MKYDIIEAATACNVTLNVIHHWRRDYAGFLTRRAHNTGGNHTFTRRDLAVLKYIALLHAKRIQRDTTLQKLGETPYLEILKLNEQEYGTQTY